MWCECVISPKTRSNISAMKRWIQSLICEQIEDFEDSDDEEEEEAEEFQDCVEYNSPSEDSSGVCGAGDGTVGTPSGPSTETSTGTSSGTSDRAHRGAPAEDKDASRGGGGGKRITVNPCILIVQHPEASSVSRSTLKTEDYCLPSP